MVARNRLFRFINLYSIGPIKPIKTADWSLRNLKEKTSCVKTTSLINIQTCIPICVCMHKYIFVIISIAELNKHVYIIEYIAQWRMERIFRNFDNA